MVRKTINTLSIVSMAGTTNIQIAACNPCSAKKCNPCAAKRCNPCAAKK